jgi:hypothetical protein
MDWEDINDLIDWLLFLGVIYGAAFLWNRRHLIRPCPACGRRWRGLALTGAPVKRLEGGELEREYLCKHCGETAWLQDLSKWDPDADDEND